MINLSSHHLDEISAVPNLGALVDNNTVQPRKTDEFTQLCVQHNCFFSFMQALPHSSFAGRAPLTLFARFNAWGMVEKMDFGSFSQQDWGNALRCAGKFGHIQFIQNVLNKCKYNNVVKSALMGAIVTDQVQVLQQFLSQMDNQESVGHISVTAALHGSIKCTRYCQDRITPQQWLNTLYACVYASYIKAANMLLENVPPNLPLTQEWCVKMATTLSRDSKADADDVWRFLAERICAAKNIQIENVLKVLPSEANKNCQKLMNLHQNMVLTAHVAGKKRSTPKRKV